MSNGKRVSWSVLSAFALLATVVTVVPNGPVGGAQALPVSVTWTTESDFTTGSGWNVDTGGSPGNVTLTPSPTDWIKAPGNPVLDVGPAGAFDDYYVAGPLVLYDDGVYKMWYVGSMGGLGNGVIGYAKSDDGIVWRKHSTKPVLDRGPGAWDSGEMVAGSVIREGGIYKMWYGGWGAEWRIL